MSIRSFNVSIQRYISIMTCLYSYDDHCVQLIGDLYIAHFLRESRLAMSQKIYGIKANIRVLSIGQSYIKAIKE